MHKFYHNISREHKLHSILSQLCRLWNLYIVWRSVDDEPYEIEELDRSLRKHFSIGQVVT